MAIESSQHTLGEPSRSFAGVPFFLSVFLALFACLCISLVSDSAQACTMTAEFFDYAPGDLAGQGNDNNHGVGAEWVGVWEAGDDSASGGVVTPTDGYQAIDAEKVTAGSTEGDEWRISREMDLTGTINLGYGIDTGLSVPAHLPGTTFFTVEMTAETTEPIIRSVDANGEWRAGVEFADEYGLTAGFGMASNGGTDNFYGVLGTQEIFSSATVEENTSYWLYGALDVDYDSTANERLSIWINPDFSDVFNSTNPDILILEDLEAGLAPEETRDFLGDEVILTTKTSSTDTGLLDFTWDDLQVARDIEFLSVPRLDIGDSRIQEGWEEFNSASLPATTLDISFDQADYYPSLDAATYIVNISIASLTPGETLGTFDQSFSETGENDDMRGDGITATGGLILTMSGMLGDMYMVKVYGYHPTEDSVVQVSISYDGIVWHDQGMNSYRQSIGDDDAIEVNFHFDNHDPNQNGVYLHQGIPVYVKLEAENPTDIVSLNALEFVPEPGTALMVGMGLALLSWRRQQQVREHQAK